MVVIEILLPFQTNDGRLLTQGVFESITARLTLKFRGVTAFLRTPADGAWVDPDNGKIQRDEIAVVEVMAETLERDWWAAFRQDLEKGLGEKEIIIRAHEVERL